MATTNVPKITWGPTGFVAPTEQQILAGVQADIDAAFGGGLNPGLTTPQGQMATTETAIIGYANDTFMFMATQVDPNNAQGRMQDAIGEIYFLQRNPALPTVVAAVCAGGVGTVIPQGSLARASDGNLYSAVDGGIIGSSGSVTLNFECALAGPIPCPSGSLNTIYQAINGWDSITNTADGVLGRNVEGRTAFEERRKASVAANARGSLPSVLGEVLSVDDVLDAYVNENTTSGNITILGLVIAPKSLYVAAVGGTDMDVAEAIWRKKAPGCGYNGNTTVTVVDDENYSFPYPSWDVTFQRPYNLPIVFKVTILNNSQVPANAGALIDAAIINAFAGGDDGPRARIGSLVLATRFVGAVSSLGSWAQVVSIQIGSLNAPTASFTGSISGTTLTVTAVSSGTIAAGQTVTGGDGSVIPGTKIMSGAGATWQVNTSQTVGSQPLYGVLAASTQVQVGINQVPTISADNIETVIQ